ncbi:MAG: hypothetical protein EPN47_16700 [Acidobacteria bacterium]|nr:MAG: hypothetical protein EPN47_16700 [Acidobacteriota bacterium]
MKRNRLLLVTAATLTLIAGITLVRTFAQARKEQSNQERKERVQEGARPSSQTAMENGKTIVRLSAEAQTQAGIETEGLKSARERRQLAVPAVVLDVQNLVSLTSSYAAARANLRKAENNLSVSQPEYNRLKTLHTSQNVSAKDFQVSEGIFRNDQASVAAARQEVDYRMAALRQSWGDKIAQWVADDPPTLNRILNREDVLVQATFPASGPTLAPGEVALELPDQRHVVAKLVSRSPQVDPRIQGLSFLYLTKQQGALAPGLNLIAQVAAGPRLPGVIIPRSAVVWLNGEPWVYVEIAPDEFTRRTITASFPLSGALFVSRGFSPGDRIVSAGAQMLLSEESRPQGGGQEQDGDED